MIRVKQKKKDKILRFNELLHYSLKYLSEYLNKNFEKCLRNGPISVLAPLIINKLVDPSETFSKLANLLLSSAYASVPKSSEIKGKEKEEESINEHLIESPASHLTLKHIFMNEKDIESRNITSKENN